MDTESWLKDMNFEEVEEIAQFCENKERKAYGKVKVFFLVLRTEAEVRLMHIQGGENID